MKAHFHSRKFLPTPFLPTIYRNKTTSKNLHSLTNSSQINKEIFYIFTIFLDSNSQLQQGNTLTVRELESVLQKYVQQLFTQF